MKVSLTKPKPPEFGTPMMLVATDEIVESIASLPLADLVAVATAVRAAIDAAIAERVDAERARQLAENPVALPPDSIRDLLVARAHGQFCRCKAAQLISSEA